MLLMLINDAEAVLQLWLRHALAAYFALLLPLHYHTVVVLLLLAPFLIIKAAIFSSTVKKYEAILNQKLPYRL
jgi:hypothetical protein